MGSKRGRMRIEAVLDPEAPPGRRLSGKTAVVVDVLRATSTIASALAAGAREIRPYPEPEDALRAAAEFGGDALLGGERNCLRMEGFDLGNSPAEYSPSVVGGKVIFFSTTNGTRAVSRAMGAERIILASFLNLSAAAACAARSGGGVVLLPAGTRGGFSVEDAVCAGMLAAKLPGADLDEAAWACAALAEHFGRGFASMWDISSGAGHLREAGLAGDIEDCAKVDSLRVVPVVLREPLRVVAAKGEAL